MALGRAAGVIRRHWWIVVSCVLVGGAIGAAVALLEPDRYSASAYVLLEDPGLVQMTLGSSFLPPADPAREVATSLHVAALPQVAAATATGLGGHPSASTIASELHISSSGKDDLAAITVTDSSPVRAAEIANTYASQFIAFRRRSQRTTIARGLSTLQQQLIKLSPQQRRSPAGRALLDRAGQLRVASSLQSGNAQLIAPATSPSSPVSPHPAKDTGIGAGLGLLLGLLLSALRERVDDRLRDRPEIEAAYGMRLLAAIPARSNQEEHAGFAREVETLSSLRARLRYFNRAQTPRSILVTSAEAGEGKSLVAVELARAAAADGTRVVLVGTHTHNPVLTERLELAPGPGWADVLAQRAQLRETLREVPAPASGPTPAPTMAVLPVGRVEDAPLGLTDTKAMGHLLERLVERFDLVILDGPPLSVPAEAYPLVAKADGVIAVCRLGTTRRSTAEQLRDQLHGLETRGLGVIAVGDPGALGRARSRRRGAAGRGATRDRNVDGGGLSTSEHALV
jgi:Mrp family chromosome partitioning ATPase